MADRIPIFSYGEFYDVPRMLDFQYDGAWYFLRSYFDEAADEYADVYDVYRLPFQSEAELRSNPYYFTDLSGSKYLGQLGVTEIGLDESRRQSIDAESFARWLCTRESN